MLDLTGELRGLVDNQIELEIENHVLDGSNTAMSRPNLSLDLGKYTKSTAVPMLQMS
jgi:hypothetical protein